MDETTRDTAVTHCPHCLTPLSKWEQILLQVDRAMVCKHCWHRIIIPQKSEKPETKPKNDKQQGREE